MNAGNLKQLRRSHLIALFIGFSLSLLFYELLHQGYIVEAVKYHCQIPPLLCLITDQYFSILNNISGWTRAQLGILICGLQKFLHLTVWLNRLPRVYISVMTVVEFLNGAGEIQQIITYKWALGYFTIFSNLFQLNGVRPTEFYV